MKRPLYTEKTLRTLARDEGTIELPENALVTPAAADWLLGSGVRVIRAGATPQRSEPQPPVYVIGDPRCPVVQTLLPILERCHAGLTFRSCHGRLTGCLDALRETSADLAACSQRRAIALLEDGAIVNCVANRHPGVRAAILVRPSALFDLTRRLGINLLILETGQLSLRQMQAAIEQFITGATDIDPIVESALQASPQAAAQHTLNTRCGGT